MKKEIKTGIVSIMGHSYPTVKIGDQEWTSVNLDVPVDGSFYNGDYGRLYPFNSLSLINFPKGWRLPFDDDFKKLMNFCGGKDISGSKLKSVNGWHYGDNGTDDFGFNALPGGQCTFNGIFYDRKKYGNWWCSSPEGVRNGYYWNMSYSSPVLWRYIGTKSYGFSVRCVKDTN